MREWGRRTGLTADLLFALRTGAPRGRSFVAGVNGSAFGSGPYATICLPASDGGCVPAFPSLLLFSALAGIESAAGNLRALTGPTWMTSPDSDGSGIGATARIDGALPVFGPVAFVASLRAALVPGFAGDAFQLYGLSVGLRIR